MTIYTIGHSNHPWERFLELLEAAKIELVMDVRSFPRSRWPQFNGDALRDRLDVAGIGYRYFGTELGGHSDTTTASYQEIAKSASFRESLKLVTNIAGDRRSALMCSEHEPLECHRCLLVGRYLADQGRKVAHILRDGAIEDHRLTEQRLLRKFDRRLPAGTDREGSAYTLQEQRIRQI